MPYTDTWTDNRPPGSEAARNIDDEIRLLRAQIHERMDTLVEDWTADPIVPKAPGSGADTTRIIPFASFLNDLHSRENDIDYDGFLFGFVGSVYIAPLGPFIPAGKTVTKIEWLVDRNTASDISLAIRHRAFSTVGAANTDNVISHSGAGPQIVSSGAISIVLDTDSYFYLAVVGNGAGGNSFKIFAARITFE